MRIPCVKATGDELRDQEIEAAYDVLATMITTMVGDYRHIAPVNGLLQKLIHVQSSQVSAEFESKFVDIKGEVTLKSLPSDWLILYLEVGSDMTSDELTQVGKKDPDCISKLMMLDTQVALNQKFPQFMQGQGHHDEGFEEVVC